MASVTAPRGPDGSQMQVRVNEESYWNGVIHGQYLRWLRQEMDKKGVKEFVLLLESFQAHVNQEHLLH